jgi:hypothetical protein
MQRGGVDKGRVVIRYPFLEEWLRIDALGKPLEHHGPASRTPQRTVRHGEVVLNEVELGQPRLGKYHLVRAGDPDLNTLDVQDLGRRL